MLNVETVIIFILASVLIALSICVIKSSKENFAWSCTWTPNKDYYKNEDILGSNWVIARGAIKPEIPNYW